MTGIASVMNQNNAGSFIIAYNVSQIASPVYYTSYQLPLPYYQQGYTNNDLVIGPDNNLWVTDGEVDPIMIYNGQGSIICFWLNFF